MNANSETSESNGRIVMLYQLAFLFILLILTAGCGTLDVGLEVPPTAGAEEASDRIESETPAPTRVVVATAAAELADRLPGPVYFINAEDSQIWRVEVDGVSLTQITSENAPVDEFDVSPRDGALVYVSGNQLMYFSNALGGQRTVLLMGHENVDRNEYLSVAAKAIVGPRWSPDGRWIAFARGGIDLYLDPAVPRQEGLRELEEVLYNDYLPEPLPEEGTVFEGPQTWYSPISWLPGADRILLRGAYYFSLGNFKAIFNIEDGSLLEVQDPAGVPCCMLSIGWKSQQLLYWGNRPGFGQLGLLRFDPATGESLELVPGEAYGRFHLFAYPFEVSADQVYGFYSSEPVTVSPMPFPMRAMVMVQLVADGSAELKELRQDYKVIGEADWLPDGRGAVVTDVAGQQGEWPLNGTLHWLPADGSPAVTLPVMGRNPQWGFIPAD